MQPEVISRLRKGRALRSRYGATSRAIWRLPALAAACRIDLIPSWVDVHDGLVLDLGANVGDWTAAFLAVAPRAQVLAVEPAPAPLTQLRARFADDARVEIEAVAVSDRQGEASFNLTEHSHNSSLQMPRDMDVEYGSGWSKTRSIQVPMVTLDQLVDERPVSVVKIDVQGAESQVLDGGFDVLARASVVLIEANLRSHYEGDTLFSDLHPRMESLGYRIAGLSTPRFGISGEALWLDACYVRPRR